MTLATKELLKTVAPLGALIAIVTILAALGGCADQNVKAFEQYGTAATKIVGSADSNNCQATIELEVGEAAWNFGPGFQGKGPVRAKATIQSSITNVGKNSPAKKEEE